MCPRDSVDSRAFPWLPEIIDIFSEIIDIFPEPIDIFAETIDIFAEIMNVFADIIVIFWKLSIFLAMLRWFSHIKYDEKYMPELYVTLPEHQNNQNE